MSQDAATPQLPQPTEEHQRLQESCGRWNVHCTFYMDGSQPPMEVEATETVEPLGGFWTHSLFECDMFGAPFQGRATIGYEPGAGEYVSSWFDTMTPAMFQFRGHFDAAGKVLEMTGEGYDCTTGSIARYRTTEERCDDGTRRFEMFLTREDGVETKLFTYLYTRV